MLFSLVVSTPLAHAQNNAVSYDSLPDANSKAMLAQALASMANDSTVSKPISVNIANLDPANSSLKVNQNQKVTKRKSRRGLNEVMYEKFCFNSNFNSSALDTIHGSFYFIYGKVFSHLRESAKKRKLSKPDHEVWKSIIEAAEDAFYEERGAISWDCDEEKWVFCGWLDLKRSVFVTEGRYVRMCEYLQVIGIDDIPRKPVINQDYIPRKKMQELRKRGQKEKSRKNNAKITATSLLEHHGDMDGGRQEMYVQMDNASQPHVNTRQEAYDPESAVLVDLFSSDSYASSCKCYSSWKFQLRSNGRHRKRRLLLLTNSS